MKKKNENTDLLLQNVINNNIFKPKQDKIALESISQSHRVEKPTSGRGLCDIIVKLVSYCERAKVTETKGIFKVITKTRPNWQNLHKQTLNRTRAQLYSQARESKSKDN